MLWLKKLFCSKWEEVCQKELQAELTKYRIDYNHNTCGYDYTKEFIAILEKSNFGEFRLKILGLTGNQLELIDKEYVMRKHFSEEIKQ